MINIYLDFCRDTCLLVPYYDLDSFRAHLLVDICFSLVVLTWDLYGKYFVCRIPEQR